MVRSIRGWRCARRLAARRLPGAALALYTGGADVRVGMAADLCLLRVPLATALVERDAANVAATWIGGTAAHLSV